MPFDSRLIHPDEPPLRADGELDLPGDLAALGEQLADDAAHLAACFPANQAPPAALSAELASSAERIKGRSGLRSLAFSALVAGAGLASVAVLGSTIWLNLPPDDRPSSVSESALSPAGSALTTTIQSGPTARGPAAAGPSAALSLGELSGPELEGLFDLLDEEPTSVASISF